MRKIVSLVMIICLLIGIMGISANATNNNASSLSVGVVEKDLETDVVSKLVYSRDAFGQKTVSVLNRWTDLVDNSSNDTTITPFSTASSLLNLRSVIGSDGRTVVNNTQQFPYSAIVHLEIHFGTTTMRGTGFFIDDNVIATAGHCIYDDELGWATLITVRPGRNGLLSIPYGLATSKQLAVSTQWYESLDHDYDWGAFSIHSGIIGNPGWFRLSTVPDYSVINNAKISGYPAYVNSDTIPTYKQYEMNGTVNAYSQYRFAYTIDTSGGQSGAPILDSNNIVIGIHTSGSNSTNYGTRVTSNMLYYYNEFIANYG